MYCSDVSGAFDKVRSERLILKLHRSGLHPELVDLLTSWLRSRDAYVAINGCLSNKMVLNDMVFQGTVWGCILWNIFFKDAATPINEANFEEIIYSDELNAW